MQRIRVSLYVTVLNEAQTIQGLLESITNQTRQPDEIVIVDGGSADGTVNRVIEFCSQNPNARLIRCPESNIAKSRNAGVSACSYDVVASIDGGCVADRYWLERLLGALTPETDIVSGVYLPDAKTVFEKCVADLTFPRVEVLPDTWNLPSHRSVLFRKRVWEALGGFPPYLDRSEDTWFDLEAARDGFKFRLARDAIVYWRPRRTLVEVFTNTFRWTKSDVQHFVRATGTAMHRVAAQKFGGLVSLLGILLAVSVTPFSPLLGLVGLATLSILAARPFRAVRLFRGETFRSRLLKNLIVGVHSFGWIAGYASGLLGRRGQDSPRLFDNPSSVLEFLEGDTDLADGLVHIASIDWDWLRARQQHFTELLAKKMQTVFVERMLSLEGAVKRRRLLRRAGDSLWILSPFKLLPFESKSDLLVRANRALLAAMIRCTMALTQIRRPIILYSTYDDHDLLDHVPHALVVYDCVDRHESFSWATTREAEMENKLLGCADLVVASSKNLVDLLRQRGVGAQLVRNAADVEFFRRAREPGEIHAKIAGLPQPRIGFVGYIADWVDLDLLDHVASVRPNWQLILAGKRNVPNHVVFDKPNLTFVGPIPYEELPDLLRGLDVCLIPFKTGPLTQAADTIKLYEYLSAGRVVVATEIEQTKEFSEFVYLAKSPTDFVAAIESGLQRGAPRTKALDSLLDKSDWGERVLLLEHLIREVLLRRRAGRNQPNSPEPAAVAIGATSHVRASPPADEPSSNTYLSGDSSQH